MQSRSLASDILLGAAALAALAVLPFHLDTKTTSAQCVGDLRPVRDAAPTPQALRDHRRAPHRPACGAPHRPA